MTNTYIQDLKIPIYIFLSYINKNKIPNFLKFPINPETLEKDRNSESDTANIEGLGEVSIPNKSKLSTIRIKSFFWSYNNLVPPETYVNWLESWQDSKLPAKLVVTRFNYSMNVTCESFTHWRNAGEENDIYFDLQLKEYRSYGVGIGKKYDPGFVNRLLNLTNELTQKIAPIVVEIPRPNRSSINKPFYTTPYIVVEGDTLLSIAKKITGNDDKWEELYNENKKLISDCEMNLKVGMKLNLPKSWIE